VSLNGQTLTWNRGTLAVHDAWSVTFEAIPNSSLARSTVKDCAQLTHNDALGQPVLDLIGASCTNTAVQN